ncbi:MAG: YkgJ family cysteine cluster protein [Deltaproteobacteria bacterium]|nr:YkgJ family cysteine cluster protein [Deltaproteobacteria bacterium]
MTKKDKKFISFSQAIQEILDDFRSDPKQYDLFAKVYSFLAGGEAIAGEEKCPPFGLKYGGIWYRPGFLEEKEFYSLQEFHDLLAQAFISKSPSSEDVSKIYRMVMGVKTYVGTGSGIDAGLWVETEMENFRCIQCGHCCLELSDAYSTNVYEEDMVRWEKERRWDILDYVVGTDLWISPRTGEDVTRCPWLRKLPNKNKYICRIHNTKPKQCRNYPKSKKHALRTGCRGFM